ncbi:hypothetical protein BJY04DRAFT_103795 [Aspergillus karnatakaensis]|uniref:uncharacterized protein n=1 Tax=Aspergillus karnatakaensis TaxID=1810916 RepID=UPI003CCDF631
MPLSQSQPRSMFLSLPPELLLQIYKSFTNIRDALSLSHTCNTTRPLFARPKNRISIIKAIISNIPSTLPNPNTPPSTEWLHSHFPRGLFFKPPREYIPERIKDEKTRSFLMDTGFPSFTVKTRSEALRFDSRALRWKFTRGIPWQATERFDDGIDVEVATPSGIDGLETEIENQAESVTVEPAPAPEPEILSPDDRRFLYDLGCFACGSDDTPVVLDARGRVREAWDEFGVLARCAGSFLVILAVLKGVAEGMEMCVDFEQLHGGTGGVEYGDWDDGLREICALLLGVVRGVDGFAASSEFWAWTVQSMEEVWIG